MSSSALFRGASLTKPIVALTVLAMRDHGCLSLDDAVSSYLPFFKPALPNGGVPVITLRHLLTHSSGLGYDYPQDPDITTGMSDTNADLKSTLERIVDQPLHFRPGTGWKYSVASDVLGAVAAVIEGPAVEDAIRKYVTGPLGMEDTSFSARDPSRLAIPYADGPSGPVRMGEPHMMRDRDGDTLIFSPRRVFNHRAFQSGGSGIVTTVPDYLKLMTCIQSGGAPLLGGQSMRAAIGNQLTHLPNCVGPGGSFSFLGKVTTDPQRGNAYWSTGTNSWGGAYGHVWALDPHKDVAIVSMTNTALFGGEGRFIRELFEATFMETRR